MARIPLPRPGLWQASPVVCRTQILPQQVPRAQPPAVVDGARGLGVALPCCLAAVCSVEFCVPERSGRVVPEPGPVTHTLVRMRLQQTLEPRAGRDRKEGFLPLCGPGSRGRWRGRAASRLSPDRPREGSVLPAPHAPPSGPCTPGVTTGLRAVGAGSVPPPGWCRGGRGTTSWRGRGLERSPPCVSYTPSAGWSHFISVSYFYFPVGSF